MSNRLFSLPAVVGEDFQSLDASSHLSDPLPRLLPYDLEYAKGPPS